MQASPAADWLGAHRDRPGRILVDSRLRVPGHGRIFAIGDTACCLGSNGRPLPAIAPVAKQQGRHFAASVLASLEGRETKPFRYRDLGSFATIGRKKAVIDFGRLRMSGALAWLIRSVAHIWFLIGFRSRLAVSISWIWNYLTFDRSARLITGEIAAADSPASALRSAA